MIFRKSKRNRLMKNTLTEGPVRISDISAFIAKAAYFLDAGGHSLFLGQVRADLSDNKRVTSIEYSAYPEMASAEAEKIKSLIFKEYPDVKSIEILHSTGIVRAGEIALFIMVSAGHRHQAQEACNRALELIKERFPAWKKEIFEDNSSLWKVPE